MARPQPTHWLQDLSKSSQWRHLLRATLRECTYLPDPIARNYMRDHVISRYRDVSSRHSKAGPRMAHAAKHTFSVLRRANEGYSRPLEKVLLLSYGRTGRRRHELLSGLVKPPLPQNSVALREFIAQQDTFNDDWQPPVIIRSLALSHMQNPIVTATRIRPLIKFMAPPVPKQDSWGKDVDISRRRNIRRRWYNATLNSLLPPLPKKDLQVLDGLVSGTVHWAPVKRRRVIFQNTKSKSESELYKLLATGPEKGDTFAQYANGRPHTITARFMRRQWRRLSALVPRQYWNPISQKWRFMWDSQKEVPALVVDLNSSIDPAAFFQVPSGVTKGQGDLPRAPQ